jgi:hypothetical protein
MAAVAMSIGDDLERLEAAVTRALETGDDSSLEVVGYGEITLVLRWRVAGRPTACKRLPGFADEAAFGSYLQLVENYIAELEAVGIVVPDTTVHAVAGADGRLTAYCLQPELAPQDLLVNRLRGTDGGNATPVFQEVTVRIVDCISHRRGLDAQLSNWAWTDDGLRYLDISTPFLRDPDGAELFDVELHLASVPWALRWAVRRFAIVAILDKYYVLRGALLDFAGNLHKERLGRLVPTLLEVVNRVLEEPITERQALAYYRDDARMWALLQRLRRADLWWQRTIRRRPYPFLLPGEIAR